MFSITTNQDKFQSPGVLRKTAVVVVTNLSEDGTTLANNNQVEIVTGDDSGSMADNRESLKAALKAAVSVVKPGKFFAVVKFAESAELVYPPRGGQMAVAKTPDTQAAAYAAIDRLITCKGARTHMETAMSLVDQIISSLPGYTAHHLYMTDGDHNGSEAGLDNAVAALKGRVRTDVRILGGDANVKAMRSRIAEPLGGQLKVITNGQDLATDFAATVEEAMGANIAGISLLFACKPTGRIVSVIQTSPKLDLSPVQQGNDWSVSTTAWTPGESRLYQVVVEIVPPPNKDAEFLRTRMAVDGREFELVTPSILWTEKGKPQKVDADVIRIGFSENDEKTRTGRSRVVAEANGTLEIVDLQQELAEAQRNEDDDASTRAAHKLIQAAENLGDHELLDEVTRNMHRIGVEVAAPDADGTRHVNIRRVAKVEIDQYDAASTNTRVRRRG